MIVVFDAQCLLCNRWVQFLLKHDKKSRLRFASIQGVEGQKLLRTAGLAVSDLQTLLLVEGERSWQHTAAIMRVLHALGWPWRAAWITWLIPSLIRDKLYRILARNRYRWFGRSEVCLMPSTKDRARFLD